MKNYQLQLKRFISISTLALFVSAAPLYAQTDPAQSTSQGAQQSEAVQQTDPALDQDVQPRDTSDYSAEMQQQAIEGSGREIDEPAGAENEKNWALLGLLGLLGLFGLKRRSDVHEGNYRPLRT